MLLTVYSVFTDADNNYATLRPALVVPMGLLLVQINKIIAAEISTGTPISGNTTDKAKKFDLLGHSLFHITSAASAYYSAPTTADAIKKATVDFSLAEILHKPYNETEAFSQGIITAVTPIIASLADFGAVPDDLTDAIDKRTKFLAAQTAPQTAEDAREVQNANIHPFVVEGKRILKEMCDPIINTLFTNNHDQYQLWYTAREIVHLPHGTTVVEGFVFAADGTTPIFNATIKFPLQNITVKSFLDGSYRAIKFPHGIATPTATDGTNSQTASPFEVKLGHTVKQNFKLG